MAMSCQPSGTLMLVVLQPLVGVDRALPGDTDANAFFAANLTITVVLSTFSLLSQVVERLIAALVSRVSPTLCILLGVFGLPGPPN
jgi:hypothetical protein